MSFQIRKKTENRFGFTIIELLIVIGILVVLGAILVPTVRLLNADRRIRESARMVNMFASSVRDAAVVDGEAAFMLVRNANEPDRCYELRRMRVLPPFAGNLTGGVEAVAQVQTYDPGTGVTYFFVDLPRPLPGADFTDINIGDSVKFNYRNVSYRIFDKNDSKGIGVGMSPTPGRDRYTLDYERTTTGVTQTIVAPPEVPAPLADPIPPTTGPLPYQVFRRPMVISSGRLEMPGNQFIDLSKSGPIDTGNVFDGGDTFFSERDNMLYIQGVINYSTPLSYADGYGSVVVVFDNNGAVDRFYVRFGTPDEAVYFPSESIYLLVATDREDEVVNFNNLYNNDNLWVSIGRNNGAVYTGEVAQPDASTSVFVQINDSRAIARRRLEDLQ